MACRNWQTKANTSTLYPNLESSEHLPDYRTDIALHGVAQAKKAEFAHVAIPQARSGNDTQHLDAARYVSSTQVLQETCHLLAVSSYTSPYVGDTLQHFEHPATERRRCRSRSSHASSSSQVTYMRGATDADGVWGGQALGDDRSEVAQVHAGAPSLQNAIEQAARMHSDATLRLPELSETPNLGDFTAGAPPQRLVADGGGLGSMEAQAQPALVSYNIPNVAM